MHNRRQGAQEAGLRTHILITAILLAACTTGEAERYRTVTVSADTLEIEPVIRRLGALGGFRQPESAQYDSVRDVFYVSNMQGAGSAKNNRGYIVRVAAGDMARAELFAVGGERGVTLHAPKGIAVAGDTVWVADIDVVRGFHAATGAPVAEYDLVSHGAVQLNAITTGPDATLYVTDTGILMTDKGVAYPRGEKIFALKNGAARVFVEGEKLQFPNGIDWDEKDRRFVVASFHPFRGGVYTLSSTGEQTTVFTGPPRFDGLKVLRDGRIVTTSWRDHSIHILDGDRHIRAATHLVQAADLGVDTRRNRLLVPLVQSGRVEIWQILP